VVQVPPQGTQVWVLITFLKHLGSTEVKNLVPEGLHPEQFWIAMRMASFSKASRNADVGFPLLSSRALQFVAVTFWNEVIVTLGPVGL
jgi:hypothetical protein